MGLIDLIVCRPDGTQEIEKREVPETWFEIAEPVQTTIAE